jgi:hypothetical protein
MTQETNQEGSIVSRAVALCCFGVLGALANRRGNLGVEAAVFCGGSTLVITWIFMKALGGLVYATNAPIRQSCGWTGIKLVLGRGFVLIVPFTVLALIADFGLGWHATQAFATAGIMSAGAAVGADLIRLGGSKLPSFALPMLGALAFSAIWLGLGSTLQAAMR